MPIMGIELKNKDGSKEAIDIGDSQSQGFSEGKLACVRLMKERARREIRSSFDVRIIKVQLLL